jgi:hypothetical protein
MPCFSCWHIPAVAVGLRVNAVRFDSIAVAPVQVAAAVYCHSVCQPAEKALQATFCCLNKGLLRSCWQALYLLAEVTHPWQLLQAAWHIMCQPVCVPVHREPTAVAK